jgi:AcrR family transcriptional regulator
MPTTPPAAARVPRRSYAGKDGPTRAAERRDKLVAAGIRLFGRQGFAATSIDALCAEAGLTKRYFYESFASSEDLLIAAYRTATRTFMQSILAAAAPHRHDARALVRAGVEQVYGFVRAHPDESRLIMIEATAVRSQLGRVYGRSYADFVELLVALTKPFLGDQRPDDAVLAVMGRAATGAIIHLCQGWLATDFRQPVEELIVGTERLLGGMGRELGVRGWADR